MPTKNDSRQNSAQSEPPPEPASHPSAPAKALPCPIAGIGASAGGLEALEQFLGHVPEKCGVAFVVIQHLDPTHKGIMPELLQRITPMEVFQAHDRMRVRPDCVYVIPPNKDMSILHGALHLFDPVAPRGLRLPIDFFFRSLAEDSQERSIGVILSGMGSDGTMGLRAIKEKAGVALVQEPGSAKFDSMPRSAIDAGLADIVAPAADLPGMMMGYLRHAPHIAKAESPLEQKDLSALEKVVILLRAHTGNDFSQYKMTTIRRRIERRMGIHQIDQMNSYVRYLQENPLEVELLFKELLIGVTSFFRDPEVWEQLRGVFLPELLARFPAGQPLRAWVPGCSTGEEAYSLAIVLKEALDQAGPKGGLSVQIFATDLDADAIDKARQGQFPANIAADVTPERLNRFFVQAEHGYRVGAGIRDLVTFARQNLTMDPPFTRLDLLICRNLLIYLTPELQKKLLPLFHFSLRAGGLLVLGSSESIGAHTRLFSVLNGKSRIYGRRETAAGEAAIEFPTSFAAMAADAAAAPTTAKAPESLQTQTERILLQRYAPAAVLANDQGDILYISGHTGKYLEPAAGKANWNIFAMAREGLRYELVGAFQKAVRQKGEVTVRGVEIRDERAAQLVDLTAQAITEPEALRGLVMIVFRDVAAGRAAKPTGRGESASVAGAEAVALKQEVQRGQEEIRALREEMQTAQEGSRAITEELQSANEELQSTNEELTTSREEMQSINEELQTVNAEQIARLDELAWASSDMNNLLNSTEIATVFLDKGLRVRRFTTGSERIFKLIPADVGRPLTDITSTLLYPELPDDAREVLRSLVFSEKQIASRDGCWFKVRIMPYRTQDDTIDGVVMTFSDITATKVLEAQLRERERDFREAFEALPLPIAIQERVSGGAGDYRFVAVNAAFENMVGLQAQALIGKTLRETFPATASARIEAYDKVAATGEPTLLEQDSPEQERRYQVTVYRAAPGKLACLYVDITGRHPGSAAGKVTA